MLPCLKGSLTPLFRLVAPQFRQFQPPAAGRPGWLWAGRRVTGQSAEVLVPMSV